MALINLLLLLSLAAGSGLADSLAQALREGRYQEALDLSQELIKASPRDPRAWMSRGLALAGMARDRESVDSFERALGFSPDSLPAIKAATQVGYRSHDPRTERLLERLLSLEPDSGVAHAMAGVLAFEAGDCVRAVPHFERARAETEANPQAWPLYGACLVAVDRPADAVSVFERLLALNPENARARFNLGYAEVLAHRETDAVQTLEPLAADIQGESEALNLLATAEASIGRLEAVAHLQRAIRLAPKDERNYLDLASLCIRHESAATASAVVDAGIEQLPQSARLHTIRGVLSAQQGHQPEALAEFELANRLDPQGEFGAAGLGVLYSEMRQTDVASTVLRGRIRKSPNDPTLNFFLAQALVKEGLDSRSSQFLEAVSALKAAVASKPEFAKARSLLGRLYRQAGDYTRAAEQLQLATKYDPLDRMAWSQLAIVFRHVGRQAEATAALEELKRIIDNESRPKADYKVIRLTPSSGGARL